MNRCISTLSVITLFLFAIGCSTKKADNQHLNADDSWPEMDAFHMIMAETFHPYKDSSNLEPVKTRYLELVSISEKWINSPIPEKVNTQEVKEMLNELRDNVDALSEIVKTGTDEEVGSSLVKLHDGFHKIQETWYTSVHQRDQH